MRIGKFLLCGLLMALPVLAEEAEDRQTATSLHYVSHELDTRQDKLTAGTNAALTYTNTAGNIEQRTVKANLTGGTTDTSLPQVNAVNAGLNTKQDDISAINDHTAVTYTGQTGQIGQKGIYQTDGTYAEQSDSLIDAKTFNAALKNGLDSEFVCGGTSPNGTCWLWQIHTATATNHLPPDYTELEYIEGTGEQYINTRYYANQNTVANIKFINTENLSTTKILLGDKWYGSTFMLSICQQTNAPQQFGDGSITRTNYWTSNTLFDVVMDATGQTVNGVKTAWNTPPQAFTSTSPLLLGGGDPSVGLLRYMKAKIYYVKIWDNGTLVHNFIPAQHGDDVGMYDTVSREFFKSVPTGTNFVAGDPINNIVYLPQNQ